MDDLELFDQHGTAIDLMHGTGNSDEIDLFVCEDADSFHAFATLNRDQVKQIHEWLGEWLNSAPIDTQ